MSKPTDCISVDDAKKLQSNWNDTQGSEIAHAQGSAAVNSVTFNIDQLEQYIGYVREQSAKQGIETPGIRVYFAAYDNAKSDKATVFLSAAESDDGNSGNNYNVEPLNRGNSGWPPYAY